MKYTRWIWAAPIAFTVGLAGCATEQPYYGSSPQPQQPYYGSNPQSYPAQPQYPQAQYPQAQQYGYVDRIEVINRGSGSNVTGTIIGGIVGGLIGTQIGRGTGRTAATIAGAVGGAAAGNAIEGRQRTANETFRVTVRLDNGAYQTITQDNISDLRTGDRVRFDGNAVTRMQ